MRPRTHRHADETPPSWATRVSFQALPSIANRQYFGVNAQLHVLSLRSAAQSGKARCTVVSPSPRFTAGLTAGAGRVQEAGPRVGVSASHPPGARTGEVGGRATVRRETCCAGTSVGRRSARRSSSVSADRGDRGAHGGPDRLPGQGQRRAFPHPRCSEVPSQTTSSPGSASRTCPPGLAAAAPPSGRSSTSPAPAAPTPLSPPPAPAAPLSPHPPTTGGPAQGWNQGALCPPGWTRT